MFFRFSLPGGTMKLKDSEEEIQLEPISGKLKLPCPLANTLGEALNELQSGGGVYNPRKLFSKLTNAYPQFGGGDQHDSHELLRHLLEGVRYLYLNFSFLICHKLFNTSSGSKRISKRKFQQICFCFY